MCSVLRNLVKLTCFYGINNLQSRIIYVFPQDSFRFSWALESYRVSYRVDLTGLPGTPSLPGKSPFLPGKSPCRVKAVETEGGPQGTKTAGIPQPFLTGVEVCCCQLTSQVTMPKRDTAPRRKRPERLTTPLAPGTGDRQWR